MYDQMLTALVDTRLTVTHRQPDSRVYELISAEFLSPVSKDTWSRWRVFHAANADLVAIDRQRVGQYVFNDIVSNQSLAVDAYVELMDNFDCIETAMTDKSVQLSKVYIADYPRASLVLCKFHALRAVKRKLKKMTRRCGHSHVGGPAG